MRHWVRSLLIVYAMVIWSTPCVVAGALVLAAHTMAARLVALALAPVVITITFVLTAGGLSAITRRAIVPGRVTRDLGHPIYGPRRLYGICWTSLYYCTPIYHAVLAVPLLKRLAFALFGYRGAADFTVYPDTWIRDLPLLDIGPGAYIANRATLGTNICAASGDIVVDRIKVGARAMVGHLSMVGLGSEIGDDAEVGPGSILGVKVKVGARAKVGAGCGLNHGVRIGNDCVIGAAVTLNERVVIADGIHVPFGAMIPVKTTIRTQAEADAYRSGGRRRSTPLRLGLAGEAAA